MLNIMNISQCNFILFYRKFFKRGKFFLSIVYRHINEELSCYVASLLPLLLRSACNFSQTFFYQNVRCSIVSINGDSITWCNTLWNLQINSFFTTIGNKRTIQFDILFIHVQNNSTIAYVDAHRTMPCGSISRIFGGFRLHKTATRRFYICSIGTYFASPLTMVRGAASPRWNFYTYLFAEM